jgi:hypothetical protein
MNPLLWKLYRGALMLLPAAFRQQYADQILQTARDAATAHPSALLFPFSLFSDLALTAFRENARMLGKQISRHPFFYQALCLSIVAFVLAFAGYAVMHLTIRHSANQPQRQMADDAARIYSSADRVAVTGTPHVELSQSLEPFTIAYDESGRVINYDGALNGVVPAPPAGVFAYARQHGSNELTWQPRRDVRLAIVVRHFTGAHCSGFVLVGRSLATAEQGEMIARWAALLGWIAIVVLLTLSASFFSWMERRQRTA